MLDIINYFIGGFHRLFFYVDNDWINDAYMKYIFVSLVGLSFIVTLIALFACAKCALSWVFSSFKGM